MKSCFSSQLVFNSHFQSHESTTKEDIVPLFEKHGTIELFTFMEKKHMAYLKFTNEAEAVKALIDLHGRVINGLTLKVSFAKQ